LPSVVLSPIYGAWLLEAPAATGLDQATLEALYAELEKPLYNVVFRWVWNPEDARDLVQEAFVRLGRMRDRIRVDSARPLVYKIALNLALNRRRSRKLWRWVSLEAARGGEGQDDPWQTASDRERQEAVRRAIDALPERHRRVVALCELAGMSYRDAAAVLGIPAGTVASRKHAAMKLLEKGLGPIVEGSDDHPQA